MIKSLTSLRGIFILFIFLHHCKGLYPGGGTMAVAFFFVLGGFSMTLGYQDKMLNPDFNYKNYLKRRSIKFYPLHWLCLLLVLPLALNSEENNILVLIANALLIQSWIPIDFVYFSFNWVSWYLADTMFFSIMFPFVLRMIIQSCIKVNIIFVTCMALLYSLLIFFLPVDNYHAILYVSPLVRMIDFIFGIYLALFYFMLSDKRLIQLNSSIFKQLIIFSLITILVFESCVLTYNTSLLAPVYWPLLGLIILSTALFGSGGGGIIYWKINTCDD